MAIQRRTLVHEGPGGSFEGVVAWDDAATGPRPGILVLPNVLGQKEADNATAERLAAMGYVAFAADVFGQGKRTMRQSPNPAQYMDEMNADRAVLRERLHRSLTELKALAEVDAAQTAAIGFCFGGKCAIDLARTGSDLLGVVSFHGVYDPTPFANVVPIRPKLLICHGWDDPIAPPEATVALATELTAGEADWQIHAYGKTGHGFTDESANMPERGIAHQPDSARRSWKAMTDFLEELFG